MRKICFSFLVLICFVASSCTNDEYIIPKTITKTYNKKLITYINDQLCDTRSYSSLFNDWENINQIKLPSGSQVYTPWNNDISSTTIPASCSNDIQKKDGWNLLAQTLDSNEKGLNYLFFYNKFTGILKVFYYLEENFIQTTGLWHVHVDKPTNLLAFTGKFALPTTSATKIQDVYCSNITINENKAFTKGWNCFEIELAYDPNVSDAHLYIEPCGIITSNIEVTGNFDLNTSETIVQIGEDKKSAFLKLIGTAASKYIEENFKTDSVTTRSIDWGGILSKGVQFLFKSFTASNTSEPNVSFTTTGSVKINGDITTNINGGFSPIRITLNNDSIGSLGLWNIVDYPNIYYNTLARKREVSGITFPVYQNFGSGQNHDYRITINPNVDIKYSKSYKVFATEDNGSGPKDSYLGKGFYYKGMGKPIGNGLHEVEAFKLPIRFTTLANDSRDLPGMIYIYDAKNDIGENLQINNCYLFKINLNVTGNDSISYNLCKSIAPRLNWRTDNLQKNQNIAITDYPFFIIRKEP